MPGHAHASLLRHETCEAGTRRDVSALSGSETEQHHGACRAADHPKADSGAGQQDRRHQHLAERVVVHRRCVLKQQRRQQHKEDDVRVRALPADDRLEEDLLDVTV